MAVDKLVDSTQLDADLASVASAIRTKGGTSIDLAFPAGFVSAIQAIPTGGGATNVHTFYATPETTANTLSLEVGDFTMPNPYFLFLKSNVTEGDGAHAILYTAVATNETAVSVVKRYRVYKASSGTDYYDGNPTITKSGTTLTLKWSNTRYFKAGSTYGIQIWTLDSFFTV